MWIHIWIRSENRIVVPKGAAARFFGFWDGPDTVPVVCGFCRTPLGSRSCFYEQIEVGEVVKLFFPDVQEGRSRDGII